MSKMSITTFREMVLQYEIFVFSSSYDQLEMLIPFVAGDFRPHPKVNARSDVSSGLSQVLSQSKRTGIKHRLVAGDTAK